MIFEELEAVSCTSCGEDGKKVGMEKCANPLCAFFFCYRCKPDWKRGVFCFDHKPEHYQVSSTLVKESVAWAIQMLTRAFPKRRL